MRVRRSVVGRIDAAARRPRDELAGTLVDKRRLEELCHPGVLRPGAAHTVVPGRTASRSLFSIPAELSIVCYRHHSCEDSPIRSPVAGGSGRRHLREAAAYQRVFEGSSWVAICRDA